MARVVPGVRSTASIAPGAWGEWRLLSEGEFWMRSTATGRTYGRVWRLLSDGTRWTIHYRGRAA